MILRAILNTFIEVIKLYLTKLRISFQQFTTMIPSTKVLKLNLLPPEKLYCDFNYWSNLFTHDMQMIWDKGHRVPLNKLPPGVSDMIFPYLLLALSDYKILNKKHLSGIGLDNLLNLWFDKYSLNKKGYFQLTHSTSKNKI